MASGAEHYREGEAQLEAAAYFYDEGKTERADARVRLAQAHFTAALAAATALTGHGAGYLDDPEIRAWRAAAGVADA